MKINTKKDYCKKSNAWCVEYEGFLPEYSELAEEQCVVVHEVLEELYKEQLAQSNILDLSDIDTGCVEVVKEDKTLPKLMEKLFSKVCEEGETVKYTYDISKIDTKCLQEPCEGAFGDINELFQAIIDKLCELDV